MAANLPGATNPNWQGGRTVTSHGYVLIKRREHPAADVRGYVYEHRLVMEAILGRYLHKGERVRHVDGDPGNNAACNLRLKPPLNRKETVTCACGCGKSMTRLDSAGRVRRYASGHNNERGVREGARPTAETGAGLPEDLREDLTEVFGGLCAYGCGRTATCWDHLIPWSRGGSFLRPGNAVPACRPCNQAKSDSAHVWQWIERGYRSEVADGWEQIVDLALAWGDLDVDDEAIRIANRVAEAVAR